jgi:hypothetical protein
MNQANATKQAQYTSNKAAYDNGYLVLYSGTVPATADTALSGNTALTPNLRYNTTAFATGSNGSGTNNAMTSDTNATAGTATFARSFSSVGVAQGNVIAQHTFSTTTAGTGEIQLASATVTAGSTVSGSAGVLTFSQG